VIKPTLPRANSLKPLPLHAAIASNMQVRVGLMVWKYGSPTPVIVLFLYKINFDSLCLLAIHLVFPV
jgi:hypothetical protein